MTISSLGGDRMLLYALLGWLVVFMALPGTAGLSSYKFIFSYVYMIAMGGFIIWMALKRRIGISPVAITIVMGFLVFFLPLVKIYFDQ